MTAFFRGGPGRVARAELNYTADKGVWKERNWISEPVRLDAGAGTLTAEIPGQATVYYLNLFTDDNLAVSSVHEEL